MSYTNGLDDPSAHFQTKVYTGTNANQSITNDGNSDLQPDWIFASYRTLPPYTNHRAIIDSSRGRAKILESDTSAAEATTTNAAYDLVSFDTDGFTVGAVNSTSALNASGISNVAWQWKCNGGTTSTDTTSSITSTVQVNSDAGFSIVTYTGDGTTTGGFGHGLGVAPKVVFVKRRNTAADWCVYHKDMGAAYFMKLNTSDAKASGVWQDLDPSSNTVVVYNGGLVNGNGDTYVAYCFAEKQGYSKFGSYVGNGNADGPFVYTGFKPAFFLLKKTSGADGWRLFDNKRAGYNDDNYRLAPDAADAEDTATTYLDILSNGVKIRGTAGSFNQSGGTFIYMAFAENPFVTSTGIPTTAR